MRHRLAKISRYGLVGNKKTQFYRSLVRSLVKEERIITTKARATTVQKLGDKVITLGKRGTVGALKKVQRWMGDDVLTEKVCKTLALRYLDRPGGYVRKFRIPSRAADAAPMALVEFVDNPFPSIYPAKGKGMEEPKKKIPVADGNRDPIWVKVTARERKEMRKATKVPVEAAAEIPADGTPV